VSLTVDPTNNQILAFGPPKLLDRIEALISTLDQRQPQVLVEATVVSLSESEARSLGVELASISKDGDQLFELASLFGVGAPDPASLSLPALSGTGVAGTVLNPGSFSAAIRALQTVSDGRSLSRPKLLVNAGRTADLGATLQTPYTSTNASSTVSTTSLGGTLDAGTEILVTPRVAEGGRIVLEYTVSLSSFVGEASDPSLPPPRQENHIKSEVTIPDGYTVVVGGLEIANEGSDQVSVPLLGQLPLLGWMFRDDASSSSTSRFYVFLRCSIMNDERFEGLRYVSDQAREEAGLPSDWPAVQPMVMR
jgi:type II secretory pathway component GspD/PulD (secretin)